MFPLLPFHPGGRGGGWTEVQESSLAMVPLFGGLMLLLLLLALGTAALLLWRSGRLALPALGGRPMPEEGARQILAERFARGDITTDEFLERASILNWTPGVEPAADRTRRRTR